MSVTSRRWRTLAAAAAVAGLVLGAAACSKDPAKTTHGPITIKVQTFGNFGYGKAVEDWNASHTDIKIDHQKMGELRDFAPQLAQWLAAGAGAGDVVGLEEGQLLGYIKNHQGFLNLFDVGGKELEKTYVSWKWERGLADDGKFLLGLGTDVGGTALCYRRDLFEKAHLPTDREAVAQLIPTWDAYVSVGKQFAAANTGAKWLDSATSIMQPYIMQQGSSWNFDASDKFIGDTNPTVRKAWDLGLQMAAEGLTAKLARWSPDWDAAFKNSAFATVFCPAWMTEGVIKPRAGDGNTGKWDVATMPGGVGNWGGSYLAVPKQTTHPKEAYQVAKYLTSKEGHLAAFKEAAAMPSDVAALDDPAFANSTSAYFNNAPIGKIFAASVKGVKPMVLGSKHQQIWETICEPAMQSAEQGKATSDAAWVKWVGEAKKLVSG